MSNIKVSIIIPCYNMGHFLPETLDSVAAVFDPVIHEVIIVNDGSTDQNTIELLRKVEEEGKYKVFHQQNKGVAAARNLGIYAASGTYILPLDADNLLTEVYLEKGVRILDSQEHISVVYGQSKLFGEENEGFLFTHEWSLQTLLSYNYIDNCVLCRKSVLLEAKGYDEERRIMGLADWELWIRLSISGCVFHFLRDDVIQHYRVTSSSMIRSVGKQERQFVYEYLQEKHKGSIDFYHLDEYYFNKFRKTPAAFTLKLFIRRYFKGYYNKLVRKGRLSKYL